MFCDIANLDGSRSRATPARCCAQPRPRRRRGFQFMCAPEVEFFYFKDDDPSPAGAARHRVSYFDLTTYDDVLRHPPRTIQRLEATGIPVEYSFHEDAPVQHEIDLRYTDA
jgi:glutamine synthetase